MVETLRLRAEPCSLCKKTIALSVSQEDLKPDITGLDIFIDMHGIDEDTPHNLIQQIQPDILVKGSDYKPEEIVGADIVLAKGGKIETIDFLEGYSTTGVIEKLRN